MWEKTVGRKCNLYFGRSQVGNCPYERKSNFERPVVNHKQIPRRNERALPHRKYPSKETNIEILNLIHVQFAPLLYNTTPLTPFVADP